MLLKVMHIIYHLDARELRTTLSVTDNDIFSLVEESVTRMFDELRTARLPVVEFSWSRKTKESQVTKLLLKKETSAARVFDRLRFRLIVRNAADLASPEEAARDLDLFHPWDLDADTAAELAKRAANPESEWTPFWEYGAWVHVDDLATFKGTRHPAGVIFCMRQEREAAALIPAELLLVETDAPFLTPHPFRGAPNESYCLPYTVRALAEIRNSSAAEIAAVTSENASKSYGLYH